ILLFLISIRLPAALGQDRRQPGVNHHYLGGFITASLSDRPRVAVELLSELGKGAALLKSLKNSGAEVQFADEKVGYALALVARDKLLDTLDLPYLVLANAIDGSDTLLYRYVPERFYVPLAERKPKPVPAITLPIPRVGTSLPKDGPYFASKEAG